MSWAADELAGVDLGDGRLNKRVVKLLERFAAQRRFHGLVIERDGRWLAALPLVESRLRRSDTS